MVIIKWYWCRGGEVLSYLGMVGRSALMAPVFDSLVQFGPYFMPNQDLFDPLFLQKNLFVSISFSSRDTWT